MPKLTRICGQSASLAMLAICSPCKTRLRTESRLRSTPSWWVPRPPGHRDARDCLLRGRAARLKPPSRESRAEAVALFELALALDQESVAAQSWLAIELTARILDFMTDTAAADNVRAERLADRALAASPRGSVARFAKGQVLRA